MPTLAEACLISLKLTVNYRHTNLVTDSLCGLVQVIILECVINKEAPASLQER